jgi:diguanylate cyclase (GGDEF)-like protein
MVPSSVESPEAGPQMNGPLADARRGLGAVAVAVGLLVLFGYVSASPWLFRAVPGYPAVHPVTAIALVLLGVAAMLPRRTAVVLPASLLAASLATVRLIDLVTNSALLEAITPFPAVLATQADSGEPVAMGVNSALGVLAISAGQLLVWRGKWTASQMVGWLGGVPFALAVIGYAFQLPSYYGNSSPVTVVGGLSLAVATMLARPDRAIVGIMLGRGAPGRLARRLLSLSIATTLLVGWALSTSADAADRALLAEEVVIVIAVLAAIVTATAVQFDDSDRRRQAQDAELRRTVAALRSSERALAEEKHVLHTTLEQMDQGIMMIDADRTVALCNRNAIEMLNLPPDLMAARPAFADVLAYQRRVGEFDGSDANMQELIRVGGLLDRPHIYERQRPNGRVIEIRSVPLAGGGVVRTYSDITARRAAEERIRFVARHDDLTQVANRPAFRERLLDAIAQATTGGRRVAVLYLDLDRFKLVNDTRGHLAGDALLAQVADRIRAAVRDIDTVARVGSDEFAIVQTQVEQPLLAASSLAQRLVEVLSEPYMIDGLRSTIGVSIGIAIFPAMAPHPTRCWAMPTPRCTAPRPTDAERSDSSNRKWTSSVSSARCSNRICVKPWPSAISVWPISRSARSPAAPSSASSRCCAGPIPGAARSSRRTSCQSPRSRG